jgi:hypothetical protein
MSYPEYSGLHPAIYFLIKKVKKLSPTSYPEYSGLHPAISRGKCSI